jgi:hypothetical protein
VCPHDCKEARMLPLLDSRSLLAAAPLSGTAPRAFKLVGASDHSRKRIFKNNAQGVFHAVTGPT